MSKEWDIAKEALGFLGAVLIAYPWFHDFFLRLRHAKLHRVPAGGRFREAVGYYLEQLKLEIERPKRQDLLITIVGLVLLAASFLIGFLSALARNG